MQKRSIPTAFLLAVSAAAVTPAAAQVECGLCAASVTINSSLARCFLDKFADPPGGGTVVAVDLEDCEEQRGVVSALRAPQSGAVAPTRRFILSLPQLACLKRKLEEPGLVLDPSATIDLGSCS